MTGAYPTTQLAELQGILVELKDAFPDQKVVGFEVSGRGTVQQLVSVLDAAAEITRSGQAILLFDEAVFLPDEETRKLNPVGLPE